MSVGSKVVLLVSLGFIGFLVWFYGGSPEHPVETLASAPLETPAASVEPAEPKYTQAAPAERPKSPPVREAARNQSTPLPSADNVGQPDEVVMGASRPVQPSNPLKPATNVADAGRTASRPVAEPTQRRPATRNKPVETVETTAKVPAQVTKHVIAPGETLSDISLRYYGSVVMWDRIVSANAGIDPNRLRVGRELKIPPAPVKKRVTVSAPSKPREGTVHHTVETGDSLSSISLRYYGKEYKWDRIFNANSKQLGGNPDRLKIGMVLVVPLES